MSQPPVKKKRRLANQLGDPPRQASKATYIYNPPLKIADTTPWRQYNTRFSGSIGDGGQWGYTPGFGEYRKRKMAGQGRRRMTRAKRRRRTKKR